MHDTLDPMEEREITSCLEVRQEKRLSPKKMQKELVLHLSSKHPTK